MTEKTAEELRAEAYELIAKAMGVEALRPDDRYFLDTLAPRRLPLVRAMIEEGVKNHSGGVLADVEDDVLAGMQLATGDGDDLAARAKLAAIRDLLEAKRTAEVPSKSVQKLVSDILAIVDAGVCPPATLAEPVGSELEAVHA